MWTWAAIASAVIPANIVIASTPMIISVVAALRLFGGSNAGTPLETASTPVSAVQPEANARRTRNTASSPPISVDCAKPVAGALRRQPVAEGDLARTPTASSAKTQATNP